MAEYSERSPLWGVATWGSLAVGAGLTMRRSWGDLTQAFHTGETDIAKEVFEKASSISKTLNTSSSFVSSSVEDLTEGMINQIVNRSIMSKKAKEVIGENSFSALNRIVTEDIAQSFYETALSSGKVSEKEAYELFKKVSGQTDAMSAFKEATSIAKTNNFNLDKLNQGMSDIFAYKGKNAEKRIVKRIKNQPARAAGVVVDNRQSISMSRLEDLVSPDTYQEAIKNKKRMEGVLTDLASKGVAVGDGQIYAVPGTIDGARVTTPMYRTTIAGQTVVLPLAETGLTFQGKNFTSAFETSLAYNEEKVGIPFIERQISAYEQMATKVSDKLDVEGDLLKIREMMYSSFKDKNSVDGAQAVFRMPEEVMPSGSRAVSRVNRRYRAVYTGDKFTSDIRNRMIEEQRLFYATSSGSAAKGTAFTADLATEIYGEAGALFPSDLGWVRNLRAGFGPTEVAKKAAAQKKFAGSLAERSRFDRIFKGDLYDDVVKEAEAPQMLTFFAKPADDSVAGPGFGFANEELNQRLTAESAIVDREAAVLLDTEGIVAHKITLREGLASHEEILNKLAYDEKTGLYKGELDEFIPIENGPTSGIFGTERDTGKRLALSGDRFKRQQLVGFKLTGSNEAIAYVKEVNSILDDSGNRLAYLKTYGEAGRWAERQARAGEIGDIMGNVLGVEGGHTVAGQQIERIVSAKGIGKNSFARIQQQVEALQIIAAYKIDRKELTGEALDVAQELLKDPLSLLKRKTGIKREAIKDLQVVEDMFDITSLGLAKTLGFNESQYGLAFGMMKLGKVDKAASLLGDVDVIRKGIAGSKGVLGFSHGNVGDVMSDFSGMRGSMDPAGFRSLAMKGEVGQNLAVELSNRISDKGNISPVRKMAQAAHGEFGMIDSLISKLEEEPIKIDERNLASLSPDELIEDTGRYVPIGRKVTSMGNADKIYIPGRLESPELYESMVSGGNVIPSPIEKTLRDLHSSIRAAEASGEGMDYVEKAGKAYSEETYKKLQNERLASGKILGSQRLTARRSEKVGKKTADSGVRVGRGFVDTYDEMIERATDEESKAWLAKEKEEFLSGIKKPMLAWRQPMTGSESSQLVEVMYDPNVGEKYIEMPFETADIEFGSGFNSTIKKKIDVSPSTGMRMDYDKDQPNLAIIADRKNAELAAERLKSGAVSTDYGEFLFKHYAVDEAIAEAENNLKATLSGEVASSRTDILKTEAERLIETKATTGKLNTVLTKMKLGITRQSPESYMDLAPLLEKFEQMSISKHGIGGEQFYQNFATAALSRRQGVMEDMLTEVLGSRSRTIKGVVNGKEFSHTIDVSDISSRLMSAMDVIDDSTAEMEATKAAKGKVVPSLLERQQGIRADLAGSDDVARVLMDQRDSRSASLTEKANRAYRRGADKAGAIARALGKAKGPALIGAAVAAGVAFMAPSVSGSIESPKSEGARGGRNAGSEAIGAGGAGMPPPPPRIMAAPKTYDMGGLRASSRANINLSLNDYDDSYQFRRHARQLSSSGNVKIRMSDDRAAMDPQMLASKIHERI